MDEAERVRHNMETLRLNEQQYQEHEYLMSQKMSQWPEPLKAYLRGSHVPASGGAVADLVAEWIRKTKSTNSQEIIYTEGEFRYKDMGPLTKEDVLACPDILCGYQVSGIMVIGTATLLNEDTALFNPLTEFDFFKVPLSIMVKLQELFTG
jgi:hypothetical protein